MKKLLMILFVLFLSAVVVAEVVKKESPLDTLIKRVIGDYGRSVQKADLDYKRFTAPIFKRYGDIRDRRIITAGDSAIKRLEFVRKGASELDGIKMEQEIEKIRKSLDERVGKAPKVTRKVSILSACGSTFQGHTYLAIVGVVKWEEARDICKRMGGHLVYIETPGEMFFVNKLGKTLKLWVGATDEHKEGDWRWLNGKPVDKSLWGEGEPNGGKRENCSFYNGGKLNNLEYHVKFCHGFICEWE